jgi:uncharacterized protein
MVSKKNRSRKANRKSPSSNSLLAGRWRALLGYVDAHRWHAGGIAFAVLFVGSLVGGYWIASRLDAVDRGRLASDVLQDMKRTAAATPSGPSSPRYERIEDIPGLPHYTETEPGQQRNTIEEEPRAGRPTQLAAGTATTEQAAWRRNALPFWDLSSKPLVAIVIDDVGIDRPHSKRAWELPGPLTLSFLPYAKDLREQASAARAHGNELMLHLPMEPNGRADPGPNALLVSLSEAELRNRVNAALESFDGYVGVNNHMGSRFTAFKPGMETTLRLFKTRGLLFLDSRTTPETVGDQLAQELGVPSVARNVFLDDDESIDSVRRKLAETEAVARRQGFVVAIGHPHEATLQALAEWLPTLSAKGMVLAPLSAALRKRNGWD